MRVLILCLLLLARAAPAANIVVNPGFEQGTLGWNLGSVVWVLRSASAPGGVFAAFTGCRGVLCTASHDAGRSFLQQDLATVPGTDYVLSFWVGENAMATSAMAVFWDGVLVADVLNPANGALVQFSFSGLHASSAWTSLEVRGRQDPAAMRFDEFLVLPVGTAAVPVPAPWGLLAPGLFMLAWRRWRCRRARGPCGPAAGR